MQFEEIIKQAEGRRLEFKEKLPISSDILKTVIAFANDAGGELYIGIQDKTKEPVGIQETELFNIEEKICNIIFDHCYPNIIPDISFLRYKDKNIVKVKIYRGSNYPYYIKNKGKLSGTYIRVGPTNRLANEEIIAELERQKRNVSFDSEIIHDITLNEIDISLFRNLFFEKTKENINVNTLKKLRLASEFQKDLKPSNALLLFSDSDVKRRYFPYAKVECARFKGTTPKVFIDQRSINGNIALQTEEAYKFVLKNISRNAHIEGVYRQERWEYPVEAVRETIRNAIVHRDYSLTGKDIKIAIYDDMVEITSPGKLLPSVDFDDMQAGQSDIRNKVIAPVFKKLGLIEQWGNGLKLIADALKEYPEIELKWSEPGLSFQVQFVKKEYKLQPESIEDKTNLVPERHQVGTKSALSQQQVEILTYCKIQKPLVSILEKFNWKDRTKFKRKYINQLLQESFMAMTIPEKPNSSKQKYYTTEKGKEFLENI
jgi:predicted HTH transcriptional regulator